MKKSRWGSRVVRKIVNLLPHAVLGLDFSWRWLRFYPSVIPTDACFTEWNRVEQQRWNDFAVYQAWVNNNALTSLQDWQSLRCQACCWQSPPKLSVVTPVYNTDSNILYECIISVRSQAYPFWQLILVDDGSTNLATLALLQSPVCHDPRISVLYHSQTQGISGATNHAIAQAKGDYVVFLDHDDRLALDALFYIAQCIRQFSQSDIVYSDRDMLSPEGRRYLHLFKPDWSPETLLSGNYIFHALCYRRQLLNDLGGFRSEFDGSQDYDLILRALETNPTVRHIAKVLYHWRQSSDSIAFDSQRKDYVFQTGMSALYQALQRRRIAGSVSEINSMWRGNYQLDLTVPNVQAIEIIRIDNDIPYRSGVQQAVNMSGEQPFIALLSQYFGEEIEQSVCQLAAWLQFEGVGMASGKIITADDRIEYAGATFAENGRVLVPYQGFPVTETGYMGITQIAHNVSVPHPCCVVIRRELWQQLNGLKMQYEGEYALLDFALSALSSGWRCVSIPAAQFRLNNETVSLWRDLEHDREMFYKNWHQWLQQGDPYYNKNFTRKTQEWLFHIA